MIIDAIQSKRAWKKNIKAKNQSSISKFAFITSTGPPKRASEDEESSRLVRTQAMRSYLNQREANVEFTSPINPISKVAASKRAGSAGKFKLASWSRKKSSKGRIVSKKTEKHRSPSEMKIAIMQDLGPFEILKIPLSPLTRRLLNHCTFPSFPRH
jgi:hypothetical protein